MQLLTLPLPSNPLLVPHLATGLHLPAHSLPLQGRPHPRRQGKKSVLKPTRTTTRRHKQHRADKTTKTLGIYWPQQAGRLQQRGKRWTFNTKMVSFKQRFSVRDRSAELKRLALNSTNGRRGGEYDISSTLEASRHGWWSLERKRNRVAASQCRQEG
jgi:hypothetical protein